MSDLFEKSVAYCIPLHTSLQLNLSHIPDASNEVHDSLHA